MMPTKPEASSSISANSVMRSPVFIASVACGSVGTGTDSVPSPRSPATVTRTCQAPALISQRWP